MGSPPGVVTRRVRPCAVAGAVSLARRDALNGAVRRHAQRPPRVLAAPQQAHHLLVGRPARKGVVGGMEGVQAAAAPHEVLQVLLHRAGPLRAAVDVVAVLDHHVDSHGSGAARRPTRIGRPCAGAVDTATVEQPRRFQHPPDERRRQPPVVVAEPVHDQHLYLGRVAVRAWPHRPCEGRSAARRESSFNRSNPSCRCGYAAT